MSRVLELLRWMSILAGALSLILLIQEGFQLGLVALLQSLLEFYNSWVEVLLGWAEPSIRAVVIYIGAIWGWTLDLNDHWKHIVIAFVAIFGGLLRAFFSRSIFAGCILVALLLAVVAASVSVPTQIESPMLGIALMLFGMALLAYSMFGRMGGASSFLFALFGLSAIPMGGLLWLGLAGLIVGVAAAIISFMAFGTISFGGRPTLETLKGYLEFAAVPVAAIAFIVTNSGLKLAGL